MFPKGSFFTLTLLLVLAKVKTLMSVKVCDTKNVSCSDVKDSLGHYTFRFDIPRTTKEIDIAQQGTSLVQGHVGNLSLSPDVVSCCNGGIVTRTCKDLLINFILRKGKKISQRCQIFNTTEEAEAVYSSSSWTPLGIASVVTLVVALLAAFLTIYCCYWKRKRENKGCGVPGWCCGRGGSGGRNDERSTAEEENRDNIEQEQRLLTGKSDGSEADGGKMVSIDMNGMTTTNDDKGPPQVNGAVPHKGQNGNLRHDPGGGLAGRPLHGLQSSNGHVQSGRTFGGQSSDRDKDGGPHSPCSQGSARPGFDEERGQALVNSQGLGSDDNAPPQEEKEKLLNTTKRININV